MAVDATCCSLPAGASAQTLVKDFGYIADLLGGRMGCFLFQLPPSYH
jgi:uncharacterized protein YecE (DUF72 family)